MFKTYAEAFNAAVTRARQAVAIGVTDEGAEIGLTRNDLSKTYSIHYLPLRKNRAGWELRCEVVRASDPLMRATCGAEHPSFKSTRCELFADHTDAHLSGACQWVRR